ncbi:hypothetical protein V3H18_06825 [Methylocystis sp. 9N]|uniref:Enoyl-CoA hydratase n=1 Tax=Methylocystis borbori TaxID=3118750 RepID=A0ABU7XGM7_9HYPH
MRWRRRSASSRSRWTPRARLAGKPAAALIAARALLRGDPQEVLARIDAEAALFAKALASPEARERFNAFFAQRGG